MKSSKENSLDSTKSIISIPTQFQDANTCFAHSIGRAFIRLFQVLSVIPKDKDVVFKFYKLLVFVLIEKYGCELGAGQDEASYFLLDYFRGELAKKDLNEMFVVEDDFLGQKGLCELPENRRLSACSTDVLLYDNNDKANPEILDVKLKVDFTNKLSQIIDNIMIINEFYSFEKKQIKADKKGDFTIIENDTTVPSLLVKDSLLKGLEPIVCLTTPERIENQKSVSVSDKKKWFSDKKGKRVDVMDWFGSGKLIKCGDTGHCVNLLKWSDDKIIFKNSWGNEQYNKNYDNNGKITMENTDIANISCIQHDLTGSSYELSNMEFLHITFDIDKLPAVLRSKWKKNPIRKNKKIYVGEDYFLFYTHNQMKETEFLAKNRLIDLLQLSRSYQPYIKELIEKLIAKHPDVIYQIDQFGRNALHYAIDLQDEYTLDAIEILLKAGVDPNKKDIVGQTPIEKNDYMNQNNESMRAKIHDLLYREKVVNNRSKTKKKLGKQSTKSRTETRTNRPKI